MGNTVGSTPFLSLSTKDLSLPCLVVAAADIITEETVKVRATEERGREHFLPSEQGSLIFEELRSGG